MVAHFVLETVMVQVNRKKSVRKYLLKELHHKKLHNYSINITIGNSDDGFCNIYKMLFKTQQQLY